MGGPYSHQARVRPSRKIRRPSLTESVSLRWSMHSLTPPNVRRSDQRARHKSRPTRESPFACAPVSGSSVRDVGFVTVHRLRADEARTTVPLWGDDTLWAWCCLSASLPARPPQGLVPPPSRLACTLATTSWHRKTLGSSKCGPIRQRSATRPRVTRPGPSSLWRG